MRKYVIGFMAGLLVASAVPAYGAVTSLVGQKVRAENTVIVNGKQLEAKAINIGGYTYSPNRAIAEALGIDITYSNGTIVIQSKNTETTKDPSSSIQSGGETVNATTDELTSINDRIDELRAKMAQMTQEGFRLKNEGANDPNKAEEAQKKLDELAVLYEQYEKEMNSLKSRKAELEAQQ